MLKNSNLILDVSNFSLAFPRRMYQPTTLRDLVINSLTQSLGGKPDEALVVLNGISLQVRKGERVGILGTNGAGKSTLCRSISGYYKATNGEIKIYGSVRALFEASLAFYPELTGRENMKILAEIFYDPSALNFSELIQESILFSELGEAIDAPLKTYSKGMQLRLSLSILSARPCDLLILDEVFDGADEFFRKKLTERVSKLIEESGAVILVSHVENQILETCNRVLVLKDGRFVFDGAPSLAFEVYRGIN